MENSVSAPPVNNALLPDIYNRLDAELIERTRVVNSLLDKRLSMQEKVLNKYRRSAEVIYKKETVKIRKELSRIRHSLPTVGFAHNLNAGLRKDRKVHGRRRGMPITEKDENPFCERHFIHFLPNKRKYYFKPKTPEESPTPPKSPLLPIRSVPNDVNGRIAVRVNEMDSRDPLTTNVPNSGVKDNFEQFNGHKNDDISKSEFSKRILPGTTRTVTVSKKLIKDDKRLRYHSSPSIL
ncbi:hypothetical protein SNE40_010559 [Patella caerulea]|uniref:Uncharacterized protein n=1 Tax=Patella caerulea TaxID=87958 RepID=A0AAN8JS71_PATCE